MTPAIQRKSIPSQRETESTQREPIQPETEPSPRATEPQPATEPIGRATQPIRRSHPPRLAGVAAVGAGTALGLTSGVLPAGITAVAVALAIVLLLPEQARVVAAFAAGAAATLAILAVTWLISWGCVGGLGGQSVDHVCGRTPFLEFQLTSP